MYRKDIAGVAVHVTDDPLRAMLSASSFIQNQNFMTWEAAYSLFPESTAKSNEVFIDAGTLTGMSARSRLEEVREAEWKIFGVFPECCDRRYVGDGYMRRVLFSQTPAGTAAQVIGWRFTVSHGQVVVLNERDGEDCLDSESVWTNDLLICGFRVVVAGSLIEDTKYIFTGIE